MQVYLRACVMKNINYNSKINGQTTCLLGNILLQLTIYATMTNQSYNIHSLLTLLMCLLVVVSGYLSVIIYIIMFLLKPTIQ